MKKLSMNIFFIRFTIFQRAKCVVCGINDRIFIAANKQTEKKMNNKGNKEMTPTIESKRNCSKIDVDNFFWSTCKSNSVGVSRLSGEQRALSN